MVVYLNIQEIKCKQQKDGKWSCDITRLFTENPQRIDDKLCYLLKTETISRLEDVHLIEGEPTKCTVNEEINTIRCEK